MKGDFSQGNVIKTIMSLAIPMTLAQLLNVAYNIIDRFFIGHIPVNATLSMTALGVCMPIIMVVTAFSNLCGMGGAPLFSMERGRDNEEEASYVMGNAFFLLVLMGLTLTVLGLVFRHPILMVFGASDATYDMAKHYMSIYLLGSTFVMISLGMNTFINAQGFGREGMITVGIGAVLNTILDPILIFRLNMGVEGAAIATVIAQLCSALWTMRFLTGRRALIRLERRYMRLKASRVKRMMSLGLTGFIMSSTNSLVQVACNVNLQAFGGDPYVGVMTIINTVREVISQPALAVTHSAQPVMSYNYGAKCYGKIKEAIKFISVVGITYTLIMWYIVHTYPQMFIGLFSKDAEQFAIGVPAMRIYFFGFFMMVLQFIGQSTFVALGKSRQAIFFSLLRKAIIVAPLTFILPRVGFGVEGVFAAEPISNFLGGASCFLAMMATIWPELTRKERELEQEREHIA